MGPTDAPVAEYIAPKMVVSGSSSGSYEGSYGEQDGILSDETVVIGNVRVSSRNSGNGEHWSEVSNVLWAENTNKIADGLDGRTEDTRKIAVSQADNILAGDGKSELKHRFCTDAVLCCAVLG